MEMVRCIGYVLGRFTANIIGIGISDYADFLFNSLTERYYIMDSKP